jgi:DNA-binding CsgD family transcriptional regulator
LLSKAGIFRSDGGRLTVNDQATDQALADAFATADNGDAAIGVKGIALSLVSRTGERYVAHVLPLTSGKRRRASNTYSAVAAVFVHEAVLNTPSPPEAILEAYGLTPTELSVLLGIVEVGGVPEIAAVFGVAESTVKTHLKRQNRGQASRRPRQDRRRLCQSAVSNEAPATSSRCWRPRRRADPPPNAYHPIHIPGRVFSTAAMANA